MGKSESMAVWQSCDLVSFMGGRDEDTWIPSFTVSEPIEYSALCCHLLFVSAQVTSNDDEVCMQG